MRLVLAVALFLGTAARAEAAPSRTKRERPVAVTGSPAEPLPEIHVAPGVPTVLLFPSSIQKETLVVERSRIRVRDADKSSIIVQAVEGYRPDERHELEVFFADGRAPARASFVLVMDSAEVDTRIDVERPELPNGACSAEVQRSAPRPEDFVLLGYMDETGVPTSRFDSARDEAQGLESNRGVSYRGKGWVLLDFIINNLPGHPPWTPREATVADQGGAPLQARLVAATKGEIGPGEWVWVLVVVDAVPPDAGLVFTLEVRGDGGRSLVFPRVTLPPAAQEGKR